MLPLLANLSPNAAILLFTLGILLTAVEMNRPGMVIPGAAGLLLSLLAAASLAAHHPAKEAVLWTASLVVLLMWNMRRSTMVRWLAAVAFTSGLIVSIAKLLPAASGARISVWAAVLSGLILGAGTTVLTRIAQRARQNKGLD